MQYVCNLTRFTRMSVTSHSQPLINAKHQFQVTNYLQTIFKTITNEPIGLIILITSWLTNNIAPFHSRSNDHHYMGLSVGTTMDGELLIGTTPGKEGPKMVLPVPVVTMMGTDDFDGTTMGVSVGTMLGKSMGLPVPVGTILGTRVGSTIQTVSRGDTVGSTTETGRRGGTIVGAGTTMGLAAGVFDNTTTGLSIGNTSTGLLLPVGTTIGIASPSPSRSDVTSEGLLPALSASNPPPACKATFPKLPKSPPPSCKVNFPKETPH
jgi:hypothetical protein